MIWERLSTHTRQYSLSSGLSGTSPTPSTRIYLKKKMTYTIDIELAISFIIGTALQVYMFIASLILKKHAGEALDRAQKMSEEADGIAEEAEKIHEGAMICLKLANELFYCHTSDERANTIIKWAPKLQEAGINMRDIDEIINN